MSLCDVKIIVSIIFSVLLVLSSAQKTMTAQQVADAMDDESLCSSTIEDNTCLSTSLISVEEWQSISITKHEVLSVLLNDSLCQMCNGSCGPLYYYATNFNVLYGGISKAAFSQQFSEELLGALNAKHECDAVFLFFFSRADRLIILRAPEGTYLYHHTRDIYDYVKPFYTRAMDEPDATFAEAANATMLSLYNCITHENDFCLKKDSAFKWWYVAVGIGGLVILFCLFSGCDICDICTWRNIKRNWPWGSESIFSSNDKSVTRRVVTPSSNTGTPRTGYTPNYGARTTPTTGIGSVYHCNTYNTGNTGNHYLFGDGGNAYGGGGGGGGCDGGDFGGDC